VLWTSGIATVLAALGIILGFTQYSTRYAGIMRWHYVTGIAFGVFSLTWVFSGLLSMEPFFWASTEGTGNRIPQALRGGALESSRFVKPGFAAGAREIEFLRIQGEPYYLVHTDSADPLLVSADSSSIRREPFSTESLLSRVRQANPDVPIAESAL